MRCRPAAGPVTACRHLFTSVNPTYAVQAGGTSYALRVHGADKWWIGSDDDPHFELDLLEHLPARSVFARRHCGHRHL